MDNVRVTFAAAEYVAFPLWEAVIEQVPLLTGVTFAPDTVQTEPELLENVTESPDEALAVRVCSGSVFDIEVGWANVMVCARPSTVKVRVTFSAAE